MINKNIRSIRQRKGLTQKHVAEQLGLSQMQYYRIETGVAKLDANLLPELAKILDVDPSNFFDIIVTDNVN
ncbi:hypothetical protein GCM10022378_11160 [Salinicoccus jeotgali]|uniref:HTH cro/C1-type domain-containing protein n=1 Tax=Salinicoccus jeotgali TaxID=381634 RepID=A0ABP7EQD5_9STAP